MMLRLLVLTALLASCSSIIQEPRGYFSAASKGQIDFANENKYDDTGPVIKQEKAYKTYKHLKDALVGYLDDPDTKLSEKERYKAIEGVLSKSGYAGYPYYEQPNSLYRGRRIVPLRIRNPYAEIKTNEVQEFSQLNGFSEKAPAAYDTFYDSNSHDNVHIGTTVSKRPSTDGSVGYYWFSDNLGNRHSVRYLGNAKFGRSAQLDLEDSASALFYSQ